MRPAATAMMIVVAGSALWGCNAEGPPADDGGSATPAPAIQPLTLAEVDLEGEVNLLGTEPFWGAEIRGDRITLEGVDRPEVTAANPGPRVHGSVAVWETQTQDGAPLELMVTETACSDGMSDRTYPLTARVVFGQEVLTGCAASADFILNTDERGEPRASGRSAG